MTTETMMFAKAASPEADLLTFDNLRLSQPRTKARIAGSRFRAINCTASATDDSRAINCTPEIPATVRRYLDSATSAATKRAYGFDLAHFTAWGGTIPAPPILIATYVAEHAATLTTATLARRLATLSRAHTAKGYVNAARDPLVLATLRGIRRQHRSAPKQAKPLLAETIATIVAGLSDDLHDLRDRALLLVGFAGGFRRSELVGLDIADLDLRDTAASVTIRQSKTDPLGYGRTITIPASRSNACPLRALIDWLTAAGFTNGPLFRPIDRHGNIGSSSLTGHAVSEIVKKRVVEAGIDPTGYSGHSLRAGYATSAAMAGHSSFDIRHQTGHKSENMVARYVRLSRELGNEKGRSLL